GCAGRVRAPVPARVTAECHAFAGHPARLRRDRAFRCACSPVVLPVLDAPRAEAGNALAPESARTKPLSQSACVLYRASRRTGACKTAACWPGRTTSIWVGML